MRGAALLPLPALARGTAESGRALPSSAESLAPTAGELRKRILYEFADGVFVEDSSVRFYGFLIQTRMAVVIAFHPKRFKTTAKMVLCRYNWPKR